MNKDVGWNNSTKTITLSGDFTVTDADSFETEKEEIAKGYIGRESAKNIALGYSNLLAKDVTFIRAELNYEMDVGSMTWNSTPTAKNMILKLTRKTAKSWIMTTM